MNKNPKKLYVLEASENEINRGVVCVCSSMRKLGEAVDYWMKELPDLTYAYLKFEENYFPEPLGWDWCYIAPNSDSKKLGAGGANVPPKEFWATNLLTNQKYKKYKKDEIERLVKDIG